MYVYVCVCIYIYIYIYSPGSCRFTKPCRGARRMATQRDPTPRSKHDNVINTNTTYTTTNNNSNNNDIDNVKCNKIKKMMIVTSQI